MQRVMFFNFNPMGMGGLWQNLSYILSNQKEELEINLHLDEWNTGRFFQIYNCFKKPKYDVKIVTRDCMNYKDDPSRSWTDTLFGIRHNIVDTTDYKLYEIQTLNCMMWHDYYPVKFERTPGNHICVYLQYENENPNIERDPLYEDSRNLTNDQSDYIKSLLKNYDIVELGPHMTIEENCKLIAESKFCIGREGGWTHVAHSCAIDYYPVMNNEHQFLQWCHGGHNKYLKPFTHVENFKNLCKEIL